MDFLLGLMAYRNLFNRQLFNDNSSLFPYIKYK